MRIFILEDDPTRQWAFMQELTGHEVTMCASEGTARKAWKPPYDVVCLDHDLGGLQMVDPSEEENTGTQFAHFMQRSADECAQPCANVVYVHSYNPVGAARMMQILGDSYHKLVRLPFGPSLLGILRELPL